jgi:hypothetical protein
VNEESGMNEKRCLVTSVRSKGCRIISSHRFLHVYDKLKLLIPEA